VSPAEVTAARKRLGLSQAELAERLRMGANGERTVRRWETGETPITGPASLALEYMLKEMGA
jgi:DNA (cytosine-5)-methyltransferase 1